MLDILRKQSSTWIVKTLLGLIVVVFIFYFGTASFRKVPKQPHEEVIARVNGEAITRLELNGSMERMKQNNPDLYKSLPEALQRQMETSVLGGLVEEKIALQEAHKLGLRVTDDELAGYIRQFARPGPDAEFDATIYKEKIRPGFASQYGMDFEEWARDVLLMEKFRGLFGDSIIVTDAQAKDNYAVEKTLYQFKTIAIDPAALSPDEPTEDEINRLVEEKKKSQTASANPEALKNEAAQELKAQAGRQKAEALALELWPLFIGDKSLDDVLKQNNLKAQDSPSLPLTEFASVFGEGLNEEGLKTLASLNAQKPFPDKPVTIGSKVFLVKFVKKELPSWDEFEKNKENEKEGLKRQLAEMAYSRWYRDTAQKANVEFNP